MDRFERLTAIYVLLLFSPALFITAGVFVEELLLFFDSASGSLLMLAVHLTYLRTLWKDVNQRDASKIWVIGALIVGFIGVIYAFWRRQADSS